MSNPGLHHNKIKTEQERSEDREPDLEGGEAAKGLGSLTQRPLSQFSQGSIDPRILSVARSIKSCGIP